MHTRRLQALLLAAAFIAPTLLAAQDTPKKRSLPVPKPATPLEQFFDNPQIAGGQISPDGKNISFLKPYKGKLNVYTRPVAGKVERLMTRDTIRPVTGYFWSQDSKQILYVQDKGGNENFAVYAVPVEGTGPAPAATNLTPFDKARAIIFAVPRRTPERILVGLNNRNPSSFDAHWVNLKTGKMTLVAENPGRHAGYMVDKEGTVRIALGQSPTGGTEIYERATDTSAWRTAASYPVGENIGPLRIHPDGKRLYMTSDHGRDLSALVLLDLATGTETVVESDPLNQVDFGGAVFSDLTDELLLTTYNADTVRRYAKTPQMEKDLVAISKLHDGSPGITSSTDDENIFIVSFNSPTDPGATYKYNRLTGKSEFLYRPRPWLDRTKLVGMKPISYTARDGLKVHGYLTLPKGEQTKNLPTVLLVHGGPWARDSWGYQPEVQMLADRGYAVLQINYRGSTGYGKKFYNAAVGQFGKAMHDDLIDGVKWAIAEGYSDPKKIAIYGGSYGGYATLAGVTFTPEVFACGVDYVGPSSLITLVESFPAYWRPFLEGTWFRFVGDPAKPADREEMKKRSPLFFVDRITAPLLVIQGANDPRVTKIEADQLVIALRDRGVNVQYLLAKDEGHGFANADNRVALYRAMELFLKDCLGGKAQPTIAPAVSRRIAAMTVKVDTLKLPVAPKLEVRDVTVGDAALSSKYLRPGTTVKRMILARAGQEQEIGKITEELKIVNGEVIRTQTVSSPMVGQSVDTVVFKQANFAPVRHRGKSLQRTLSIDYTGNKVTGSMAPASGGTAQPIDVTTDSPLFDSGVVDLILSGLPLAEGYAAKIPAYMLEAGGKTAMMVKVTGSENVTMPGASPVDAWVVEAELGGQKLTHWIDKSTREILKSTLSPAPGVELRIMK